MGRRRAEGPRPDRPVTAFSLLACPERETPAAPDRDVPVPPGLLADLHDPRLIITAEYVGPDRRLLDRREWRSIERDRTRYRAWRPANSTPADRVEPGRVQAGRAHSAVSFRIRHLLAAVLLTAVTVAPVTVLVSHRAAPASPSAPTSPALHLGRHQASGTPFRP